MMTTQTCSSGLDALLRPRSVAILGASDDPNRISGRPIRYLLEGGFKGPIYPVNPNREVVQGLKAYKSLADLPETPDVALFAIPAGLTEQAIRECVAKGVKSAVIFSAGNAELGQAGLDMQTRIADTARGGGMRILGPNCLGVFNPQIGFFGTFTQSMDREVPRPGPIGIVSQSGAYGSHIAYLARKRGIGINYWITTGNEADIDLAESLEWMAAQDDVREYEAAGFLVFEGADREVAALAALARFAQSFDRAETPREMATAATIGQESLSEHAAKTLLASAGIPFLRETVASDADGVRGGFETLLRRAATHRPDATLEGVLIAPMAKQGVEVIVGVSRDPVFGPAIMFGLGGVHVEVLKDVTFRLAPFSRDEAIRMIDEIRGRAMLSGVRGSAASDVGALADLLVSVSDFATAHRDDVETIDLNPVVVLPEGQGVVALDALLVPRRDH